jgi:hypothetical protein
MGSKRAPAPDPRVGEAALRSAELGEQYLEWMRDQSGITTGWAMEDRERYQRTFQPLEDRMIAEAADYASPERMAAAAEEARADVRQQSAVARASQQRNLAAMGVRPDSGRFASEDRRATAGEALAAAGAGNMARRQTEAIGEARMSNVVNMGRGMAVNPATSMGLGGQMMGQGFQGAMNGQGQMGNMLNDQYRSRLSAWQAQQSMYGSIGGGIGGVIGAFMSSEKVKTKKRKAVGVLDAVKDMRVEEWEYEAGKGDGGGKRHVGPYAEEFQAKTGLGDGKTISIIDAVGVNMRATQELAEQVDRIAEKIDQIGGRQGGRGAREQATMPRRSMSVAPELVAA